MRHCATCGLPITGDYLSLKKGHEQYHILKRCLGARLTKHVRRMESQLAREFPEFEPLEPVR